MAYMYLSIFASVEPKASEGLSIDPASLYGAFEQVRDGRGKKGKRYPLPLLLTVVILGKLAGETSVNGIVDWIKERQGWLRSQLNWPKRFPTNSTYSEALARCDAEQIVTVIAGVLLKARAVDHAESSPTCLPASNRKRCSRTWRWMAIPYAERWDMSERIDQRSHLLSLYECQSGIVLTQRAVRSKENEIRAAAALVHPALVKGRIENRLHRRRDVTLGEDACQVRMRGAPETLAALNGGVLALMDWLQVPNAASQMSHFCAHPEEALQLLFCKLLR